MPTVHRLRLFVLVAALLTALAGCGSKPAGIDGDLGDDWGQPGQVAPFRPAVHGCFDKMEATAPLAQYAPFDCAERHAAESFYVGDLPRSATNRDKAELVAGAECSKRADGFTGGTWRTGALRLQPVLPGPAGWSSGARWFRCDLGQVEPGTDKVVSRGGTLKAALTGAAPLMLRCFDPVVDGTNVKQMKPVACDQPHHAEFTGLWDAPEDAALIKLDDDSRMAKGCRTSIAVYAGVPNDGNLQYRAGWLAFAPSSSEWSVGIRAVQCFLWLADEPMRGSYSGAGSGKLPIHYE
ncbi:septum formation family protein [Actinoplanes sp. NPDC049265]|uniref:septum formation family protein n=1 Tax=Actinoplanes sp. NPDC049265 TaxID=3363902 RepID=UPI003714A592